MAIYKTHNQRNTMKHFTKGLLITLLVTMGLTTGIVADATKATHNVTILTADNSDGKITTKTIAAEFEKAGFFINDNRDMTAPWLRQCKAGTKNFSTVDFDVYNLFTLFKKDVVVKLGKKYPNIGLFSPMSMSIWTRKGTKTISISSLSVEAMAEIMGLPADDAELGCLWKTHSRYT